MLWVLAVVFTFAQNAWPQNPFEVLYAFETWAGHTQAQYDRLVTNWVPDFTSIGVTNFLLREEGAWSNSQKNSDYIFRPPNQIEATVHLMIWERQNVTNAHLAMLDYFATSAAPQPFLLGSSLGVDTGDRGYLGWGAVGGTIMFVRNNIFVSLSASDDSALSFAECFDSELVIRSFGGPVLLMPQITERALRISVATAFGRTYVIESQNSLVGTNWSPSLSFVGDGKIRLVAVPVGLVPQRFYRLRVE